MTAHISAQRKVGKGKGAGIEKPSGTISSMTAHIVTFMNRFTVVFTDKRDWLVHDCIENRDIKIPHELLREVDDLFMQDTDRSIANARGFLELVIKDEPTWLFEE